MPCKRIHRQLYVQRRKLNMPTKELTYSGYKYLLNRIAYWLVKNNKTIQNPKQITLNGKTKTYNQIITQIKKNGKEITSNEYISRLIEYQITKKGELPTSVKSKDNKRRYSKASYSDMVKRVRAFRNANKRNPNTVRGVYTIIDDGKLHLYLTNIGCSGMGQCTSYYCGCNSLQQCFYRLTGIKVDEDTIAKVAGTTTSGTDHQGLETAVAWFNRKYKKNIKITWKNFNDLGSNDSERWKKLQEYIDKGAVFCHLLYRNQWGHYEVPKQVNSSTVDVLNSLGDKCGTYSYCGYIENRSKSAQLSYIRGISQKSIAILTNG